MKLTTLLLLISLNSFAQTIYVSNGGDDNGAGTIGDPYKTIAKANAAAGASATVYLDKSSTWHETLRPKANLIKYKAYGSGAGPVISGYTTVSSWVAGTTGIYSATVTAPFNANLVTINDIPQRIGRWPNADTANGGFLIYTYTGNTKITNALFALNSWVGAVAVIRKDGFTLERDSITAQSVGTLTYTGRQTNNPAGSSVTLSTPASAGYGAFIENDIKTLDQFGEWYYRKQTNTLSIYFGANNPASYTVKIATLDTLVNIGTRTGIEIDGIFFEGANAFGVCSINGSTVKITNSNFDGCGGNTIHLWNVPNVTITDNTIRNSMNAGIVAWATNQNNIIVKNNSVAQTGVYPGNSGFYTDADRKGIYVNYKNNAFVRHNRIDTTGYSAVQFQASNFVVDSNFINTFCFVTDDGGGIYSYQRLNDTNRVVSNNIVINGIGAPYGNAGSGTHCEGIYLDGSAPNVYVYNNTVAWIKNRALYTNDPTNNVFRNNTCYSSFGWASSQHDYGSISGYRNVGNIYFYGPKPSNNDQNYFNNGINNPGTTPFAPTIQSALQQMGVIDSNYYHIPTDNVFFWYWAFYTSPSSFTYVRNNPYEFWRSYASQDQHSTRVATIDPVNQFFMYNDSDVDLPISLDGVYRDVYDGVYSGSVTIQPFQSAILWKIGEPPPPVPGTRRLLVRPF